jgi:hypothetical protein
MDAQPIIKVHPVRDDDRTTYIFEVRLVVGDGREVLVHEDARQFGKPATAHRQGERYLHSAAGQRLVRSELDDMRRCAGVR